MLKYVEVMQTFGEVPDEISLCINISNCPYHCPGCHSPHLWEDTGDILNTYSLIKLISPCKGGISCVAFMGGNPEDINNIALEVKNLFPGLKVAWYTGSSSLSEKIDINRFDYIKLGPYIEALGGLDSPTTNQRFYKVQDNTLVDITYKFQKNLK